MRESRNNYLYIELFLHIYNMRKDVAYKKRVMAETRQGKKRKQLPNASVGAEYDGFTSLGDQHGRSEIDDFHPNVYYQLIQNLGPLNEGSRYCNNRIGHCAENYAASGVIKNIVNNRQTPSQLSDLEFTKAFQPRTWKQIDWCANCHIMYD